MRLKPQVEAHGRTSRADEHSNHENRQATANDDVDAQAAQFDGSGDEESASSRPSGIADRCRIADIAQYAQYEQLVIGFACQRYVSHASDA